MLRPPRADEAGGLYHVLNRGNSRARIFRKQAGYESFERILAEGLERYEVQSTAKRLGLASTLRPRGRPQGRPLRRIGKQGVLTRLISF